jgi:hypothetical protein
VGPGHVGDRISDSQRWIQRRSRLLRYVRHQASPQPSQLDFAQARQLSALDPDRARGQADAGTGITEEGERSGCLAATGLTDETQDLAASELDRHVLDDRLACEQFEANGLDPQKSLLRVRSS